jgi:RNA polymerase sigma-70 factor (ECF subfamily)
VPPSNPPPASAEWSDTAIVDGLLRNDERAAEALYDKCHQVVERAIIRVLRTRDADFDDLVQGVFERVLRTIHTRRYAGEFSLQKWASSIAANVAIDALRARHRASRRFLWDAEAAESSVAPGPGPDRRLEARAEVERVQGALGRMKPELAEAFVLHDVFGHELTELAALLGIGVAAAQSRLSRGRRELMRRLGVGPAAGGESA